MRSFNQIRKGAIKRLRTKWYGLGNRVECCYCGWTGSQFLPFGAEQVPNRLCPGCGSLQRYRMLYLYLQTIGLDRPVTLLEIAPKSCFCDFCRTSPQITYLSSDLNSSEAMTFSDLTNMGMATDSLDIILCLHVLEHIPDDKSAFREIKRLLKPNGFGLLMVPIKGAKTFEDPTVKPEDYERVYGQYDHVRICGMDYIDRMKDAGLQVERLDMVQFFEPAVVQRYALQGDDRYFFRVSP